MNGKLLRQRRESVRLTQAELAKYMGITPKAVTNYESGIREPAPQLLGTAERVLVTYERAFERVHHELADLVPTL